MSAARIIQGVAVGGALAVLSVSAAMGQAANPTPKPSPGAIANGQRLAQRHCGSCHAVAGGPSPLADAPPFPQLFSRYRSGHLDEILAEGMLAPRERPEEGSPAHHPRMPMAAMDEDEVADLKAYLRSLAPRRAPPAPCSPQSRCAAQGHAHD